MWKAYQNTRWTTTIKIMEFFWFSQTNKDCNDIKCDSIGLKTALKHFSFFDINVDFVNSSLEEHFFFTFLFIFTTMFDVDSCVFFVYSYIIKNRGPMHNTIEYYYKLEHLITIVLV